MSDDSTMQCGGHGCHDVIYDVKLTNVGEFRITRLYLPGKDGSSSSSNSVQSGSIAPTESETDELIGQFENSVIKRLESLETSTVRCEQGCECVFNGRFSEWSEWKSYPQRITVVARTSQKGNTSAACEWKLMGTVRIRYKKRLGDCFPESLSKDITS